MRAGGACTRVSSRLAGKRMMEVRGAAPPVPAPPRWMCASSLRSALRDPIAPRTRQAHAPARVATRGRGARARFREHFLSSLTRLSSVCLHARPPSPPRARACAGSAEPRASGDARGVLSAAAGRASTRLSTSLSLGSRGSTSPNQTEDSSDASGKLFIGGVSWQTTEEGLAAYFKQFGELIDVALMKNKHTGQPRGFGFVKYRDSSVVDLVLAQDHLLDGRTVDVKRAVPREKAPLRSGEGAEVFRIMPRKRL